MMGTNTKPLGGKAYGSIPHLPGSRRGPADRGVNEGQYRICCERIRDLHDTVIVQEKLDGSCVAVARIGNELYALGRAGYPAASSPHEQHRMFDEWVQQNAERFMAVLLPGERLVGEWLAQAHGTRYKLMHDPFVAFDLMKGTERAEIRVTESRIGGRFVMPKILSFGASLPIDRAMERLDTLGYHGARDPVEGAVWRVERKGKVDFLAKYVRRDKVDGCYLPEISGLRPLWNWQGQPVAFAVTPNERT